MAVLVAEQVVEQSVAVRAVAATAVALAAVVKAEALAAAVRAEALAAVCSRCHPPRSLSCAKNNPWSPGSLATTTTLIKRYWAKAWAPAQGGAVQLILTGGGKGLAGGPALEIGWIAMNATV